MTDVQRTYDDEIDLLELFGTLWRGKWFIVASVLLAVLCGTGFVLMKQPVYESKVVYAAENFPSFYDSERVFADFRRGFYSERVFEQWKKNNQSASISYPDLSEREIVNGFVLVKDPEERLATLTRTEGDDSFILVRSDSLSLLNDIFDYASYVGEVIESEYVARAEEELNIITGRFGDASNANDIIVQEVLDIDRFMFSTKNGAPVVVVQNPTKPEKVTPKTALTLALCIVSGGMLGVFYVLIQSAIKNQKVERGQT